MKTKVKKKKAYGQCLYARHRYMEIEGIETTHINTQRDERRTNGNTTHEKKKQRSETENDEREEKRTIEENTELNGGNEQW